MASAVIQDFERGIKRTFDIYDTKKQSTRVFVPGLKNRPRGVWIKQ